MRSAVALYVSERTLVVVLYTSWCLLLMRLILHKNMQA
jgi:hypothetical protein